jgi:alanine racemase
VDEFIGSDPGFESSLAVEPASPPGMRPTWAQIDLENLVHNFRVMSDLAGPNVAVMPAVKADAYGHGAVECARALEKAGADWLGVALPEEGMKLRQAGISCRILCLAGFWEGQEELIVEMGLTPTITRGELVYPLDRAAGAGGRVINFHLKLDTGMGRLGISPAELDKVLDEVAELKNLRLDGFMTHIAAADEPDKSDFTRKQMKLFADALEIVRDRGHRPAWIHQANSAATMAYPGARGNMVRLGGSIFGIWRDTTDCSSSSADLRPVMSLRTRIILLKTVPTGTSIGYGCTFTTTRESRIATLPIGYNDGLRRGLSNRGSVLVRGAHAPIVGRVSMDHAMIDVTDFADAAVGDEVVVIGRQGGAEIAAEDIAAQIGTISYEVTCGVGDRVPRVYRSGI